MPSKSLLILGGITTAVAIGVVVALKLQQEEKESSRKSVSDPTEPSQADDSAKRSSEKNLTNKTHSSEAGNDLCLNEEPQDLTTSRRTVERDVDRIQSPPRVERSMPAASTETAPASNLEESVVVVSKDEIKLEDSFVQVAKLSTETKAATSVLATSTSEALGQEDSEHNDFEQVGTDGGTATTPKRRSRNKKHNKGKSPAGIADTLDTSLDVSESSEGFLGADDNNPQDDNAGPTDVSAILKARTKKARNASGHKSAAAAAAVKEIQSSTTSATKPKKKNKGKNKSHPPHY